MGRALGAAFGGLLTCMLAGAPQVAGAAEPAWLAQVSPQNRELERARKQLQRGDFEQAVRTLQAGLQRGDVTDAELVELYQLLGVAQLYLGNEEEAREAYEKLLQAKPDFELPATEPPKIRALYARILDDLRRRRLLPVTLSAAALDEVVAGRALPVLAKVQNLPATARARLHFRRAGAEAYSSVDFAPMRPEQDLYRATVPAFELAADPTPYDVEYYLEVADAARRRLAGRGDAHNPLSFRVSPPEARAQAAAPEAWYQNPWVWAVGGAVAAGTTIGIVALASSRQTGTLTLVITVGP